MSFAGKGLVLSLSIAAVLAAGKDTGRFAPGPASSYAAKQTNDKVTIGVEPYDTEARARAAFDKVNPNAMGILPILLVIENGTGAALSLRDMKVEYIMPDRQRIETTPASEVRFTAGPKRPRMPNTGPASPLPLPRGSKKSKLEAWEIEGRAFAARMLPAGDSANGFFYFQARHRPGSSLYITGIKEARTGQEIFYFEIPLQ
jgi:hypothetical protein